MLTFRFSNIRPPIIFDSAQMERAEQMSHWKYNDAELAKHAKRQHGRDTSREKAAAKRHLVAGGRDAKKAVQN